MKTRKFLSLFIALTFIISFNSVSLAFNGNSDATIEGELEILHIDEVDAAKSRTVYWVRKSVTGEMIELAFVNNPPRTLRSGMHIIAHGRFGEKSFQVNEIIPGPQNDSAEDGEMVMEAGTGIHHAIVMILNMPNSPGEATLPTDNPAALWYNSNHIPQVESQMFNNNFSVDSAYREASFDQLSFPDMGNNVVLLNIPYFAGCNYYSIASAADSAATAAGVNLGAFHNKMYLVPPKAISDCSWLALGQVGSYGGTAVKLAWSTRNDTIAYAHEFGHNLGWHHAGTDPDNDGLWNVEYGDQSSLMGYCCGQKKFNSVNVDQIGWYDSAELAGTMINVVSSGDYTIAPLGSDPGTTFDPQILKIAKPDTNETYFVSFRKKVGLDANMSSYYTTGASIHHARETGIRSYLIDVLDNGSGNQFVDSVNKITITQLESTVDYVRVNIAFNNTPDTTPPNPPTNLTASLKKVKGKKSVKMSWNTATDPSPGSGIDYYMVYRNNILIVSTFSTSASDSNYTVGGSTVYTVYSVDKAGNVSISPAKVTFTDGGNKGGGDFCDAHPKNKKCL